MQDQIYNVGIIGYGFSAKIFHIPFILDSKRFQIHSIVQRHPSASNDAGKDFPTAKKFTSATDLLAQPDIDIVVITTQPTTHFTLAKQCLEAGKHVLCEKPFSPTSKEAYELSRLAEKSNLKLYVYQNRRYDADFLTLRDLILNDKLGRIADFESHFDRHRPELPTVESWKTSPAEYSALFDLGTHLIDQIICLYGLPSQITGFVTRQRQSNSDQDVPEDSFTAILRYDSGSMATARASVVSAETRQMRFWVRGTQGSYLKYHLDPQEDQLKAGLRPGQKDYGREPNDRDGVLTQVKDGKIVEQQKTNVETTGYTRFYDELAVAIDGGEEGLMTSAKRAADVIKILELVRQSSEEGRSVDVKKEMGSQ